MTTLHALRTAFAALAAVPIAACGGSDNGVGADTSDLNPSVVSRIRSMTSCPGLQAEFDTASRNNQAAPAGSTNAKRALGYMRIADDRMKAIGCY